MIPRIDTKRFTVPKVHEISSDYQTTMARFEEILNAQMGIKIPRASATPLVDSPGTFNSENLTEMAGSYADRIDMRLKDTAMSGLGAAFELAGQKYGVNPLFLAGLAIHESGYGNSRIAQDKNNLFGFKAYDSSPYASAQQFGSFQEGIETVAAYLKEAYLNPEGKYYNGLSIEAIGKRYASDPNWAAAIQKITESM